MHRADAQFCSPECARLAKIASTPEPLDTGRGDSIDIQGDSKTITKTVDDEITNLDQLIEVCKIDTSEWVIDRFICGKWAQNWQVKAFCRRKNASERTAELLYKQLITDIKEEMKAPSIHVPSKSFVEGEYLFEFAPFDLHMGKLAWGDETVTNYDSNIAESLFNESLDFLLNRALRLTNGKLDRILCVFGNDVSHIDGKKAQTTAGTPMDADTRYIQIFRRICKVHRRAINVLRQYAPVDVKIIPGNHDEQTAFHLGEILDATFEGDVDITVDNGPRFRKYYDYGVNLFGFAHGDKESVNELPMTMAREQPELWARCSSREWHIGHKHISEKMEQRAPYKLEQDLHSDKGVRIRRLTSLSGHDAWHTAHAYMDRRACEGFVYHKTAGFTGHLSFNVDHFTGKGLKAA